MVVYLDKHYNKCTNLLQFSAYILFSHHISVLYSSINIHDQKFNVYTIKIFLLKKSSHLLTVLLHINEFSYKYDTKEFHIFILLEVLVNVVVKRGANSVSEVKKLCPVSMPFETGLSVITRGPCCLGFRPSFSPQRCCCWIWVQRLFHGYDVISFWSRIGQASWQLTQVHGPGFSGLLSPELNQVSHVAPQEFFHNIFKKLRGVSY